MKKIYKIISVITILAMLLSPLPVSADAFSDADISEIRDLALENIDSFTTDLSSYTDSEKSIIFLDAWQNGCENFAEFDSAVTAAAQKLDDVKLNKSIKNLSKQNTQASLGVNLSTLNKDIFSYESCDFIVLDSETVDEDTYFLVITKEATSDGKIDAGASSKASSVAKYDDSDENNIAYTLTNTLAFNNSIPVNIIKNIDAMHLWNTEPANADGFTQEVCTPAPFAIMSATEYVKYATGSKKILGIDEPTSTQMKGYWLRSARADGATAKYRNLCVKFEDGDISADYANVEYAIRPMFWLKARFFKENKMSACGADVAELLAKSENAASIRVLYDNDELGSIFGEIPLDSVTVEGELFEGETLTAKYSYDGKTELDGLLYSWEIADSENGAWAKIPNEESSTLTLKEEFGGKYIRACIKPVFSAGFAGGKLTKSDAVGPVVGEGKISDIINEIKNAAPADVKALVVKYNNVLLIDDADSITDELAEILLNELIDVSSVEKFREAFDRAKRLDKINNAETFNEVESDADELLINAQEYKSLATANKDKAFSLMFEQRPYKKVSVLETTARKASITVMLDTADSKEAGVLLEKYSQELEIDWDLLEMYKRKELAKNISAESFSSYDAMKLRIKELYNYVSELDFKEVMWNVFKDCTLKELHDNFIEYADAFEIDMSSLTDAEKSVLVFKAWQTGFASFDELHSLIAANLAELKAVKKNETKLGLIKQNRPTKVGGIQSTQEGYIFSYKGKKFIVLDKKIINEKDYYFVMAYDCVYGSNKIDLVKASADAVSKWDDNDKDNLAYLMINTLAFNGFNGAFPEEMAKYTDAMHVWNTEPANADGFTAETMSIAPFSIISATEYLNYIGKDGFLGVDSPGTGSGFYTRTSRGAGQTGCNAHLAVSFSDPDNLIAPGASAAYYIKPVFWLSSDFFKENAIEKSGNNVTLHLDNLLDETTIKSLYNETQRAEVFGKLSVDGATLSGEISEGNKLKSEYKYSGSVKLENVKIQWQISDSRDGIYTDIADENKAELILKPDYADKYVRAAFIPTFESTILHDGAVSYSVSEGPIFGKAALEAAINEIDDASADELETVIKKYNSLLKLDTVDSLLPEEKAIFTADKIDSIEKARSIYRGAKALAAFNAENDDIRVRAEDESLLGSVSAYKTLDSVAEVVKEIADRRPYNTVTEFLQKAEDTIAVERFNTATRNNIKDILKEYSEYYEYDIKNLSDYTLGLLGGEIAGKTFESLEKLIKAIKAAIITVNKTTDDVKEVSRGGGGGGGGSVSIRGDSSYAPKISEATQSISFDDISEITWAKEDILALAEKKIINGTGNNKFSPNKSLSREEFAKMTVLALELSADIKDVTFSDLGSEHWAQPYAAVLFKLEIISGTGKGLFGTGQNITREDMAVIVSRALKLGESAKDFSYNDTMEISEYAKSAVKEVSETGIMNGVGDGRFNPKGKATRAMAAVVIHKMMQYAKGAEK